MLPIYRAFLIVIAVLSLLGTLAFLFVPNVSDSAPICLVLSIGFLATTNSARLDFLRAGR